MHNSLPITVIPPNSNSYHHKFSTKNTNKKKKQSFLLNYPHFSKNSNYQTKLKQLKGSINDSTLRNETKSNWKMGFLGGGLPGCTEAWLSEASANERTSWLGSRVADKQLSSHCWSPSTTILKFAIAESENPTNPNLVPSKWFCLSFSFFKDFSPDSFFYFPASNSIGETR